MKALNPSTGNFEDIYVKALDSLPVGVILSFPTTSSAELPNGYMFCDGSAISRTTYSELFSLIGTSYGSGDGSTTFNLPNLKGRVQVGIDTNDTDFNTIGKTGGSKYLQAHKHSYLRQPVSYSELNQGATILGDTSYPAVYKNPNAETDTAGTGNSGNLQPYVVSNFIIKVKQTVPLAASVLNANSNSTKDTYSCDYINGTVLYADTIGTTGEITLSDNVTNYSHIEILYADDQNLISSKKIMVINGMWTYLSITQYKYATGEVITRGKNIQLLNNKIKNGDYCAMVQTTSGNTLYWNNNIKIIKVIGYK